MCHFLNEWNKNPPLLIFSHNLLKSIDGGASWSLEIANFLNIDLVNTAMLNTSVNSFASPKILFSAPMDPTTRIKGQIKLWYSKPDATPDFTKQVSFGTDHYGYSCLEMINNDKVLLLYEASTFQMVGADYSQIKNSGTINYMIFNINSLKS